MSNMKMECSPLEDSVSHLRKWEANNKKKWLAQTSAKLNYCTHLRKQQSYWVGNRRVEHGWIADLKTMSKANTPFLVIHNWTQKKTPWSLIGMRAGRYIFKSLNTKHTSMRCRITHWLCTQVVRTHLLIFWYTEGEKASQGDANKSVT